MCMMEIISKSMLHFSTVPRLFDNISLSCIEGYSIIIFHVNLMMIFAMKVLSNEIVLKKYIYIFFNIFICATENSSDISKIYFQVIHIYIYCL